MKRRFRTAEILVLAAGVLLSSACRLYMLERRLSPEQADFLNKARYIISGKERKAFLELPDAEKPAFIASFWKIRDTDPDTEANEFRDAYEKRIAEANRMFLGEGAPGWLTDRGRIFILFGPPTDRYTDPMSGDASVPCRETWLYHEFPVVFTDKGCTGIYKLVTYDLAGIRDLNLAYMAELSLAQKDAQAPGGKPERRAALDAALSIEAAARTSGRFEAVVVVAVPYDAIWLRSEGTRLRTTLSVILELRDPEGGSLWRSESGHDIDLDEAGLKAASGRSLVIRIPLAVTGEEALGRLVPGRSAVEMTLVNATGRETVKKTILLQ